MKNIGDKSEKNSPIVDFIVSIEVVEIVINESIIFTKKFHLFSIFPTILPILSHPFSLSFLELF